MPLTDIARVRDPRRYQGSRRDPSSPFRHVDATLVVATAAIAAIGLLMVYSTTRNADGVSPTYFLFRQAAFVAIGAVVMVVMAAIDYHKVRDVAPLVYAAALALLGLVLTPLGQEVNGAQAWFGLGPFQLQPAEMSKLALIVAVAALVSHWDGDMDLRRLAIVLGVAGLPMAFIMLQPDLGTVLVFVAITVAMLLVGGVRGRHILVLTIVGVVGIVGVLNSNTLAEYQQDRLTAFIDPENDTRGSTYNLKQSIGAVANGGMTGEGLFEGTQTQLGYVPEQQTDFIFTAVGEELGFVGASTLLGLYAVLLWRIFRTAQLARDPFGTLVCVGVLAMFAFQIFESVGMTTGIMPVTGIPLPFVSYGGSSTLTSFVAVGTVLSIHMRRFR
jgi:rod shape determining protein RodA